MFDSLDITSERTCVIEAIYDLLTEKGDLEGAVARIRHALGAEAVFLVAETRGLPAPVVIARSLSDNEDPARFDLWQAMLTKRGAGVDPVAGLHHVMADCGYSDGQTRYGLHALCASDGPVAETATPALLADFLRHVRRAHALAGRIGVANTERQVHSALLDKLAVGTIFLNAQGQVIQQTGVATDILHRRDGLRLVRGCIAASVGADDRKVQAAIRAVLTDGHQGGAESQVVSVGRSSGQRDLGLVIHRLRKNASSESGNQPVAVILIRDPQNSREPERTVLRRLFDLTPAEAELARSLATGLSLDEAALALNISRNTARAHLRAVFSKSGITRQTELMRVVLSSAAMLGERPILAN
ncbi:MAG: helix-turn-helix transcriptional regulator [Cypionkella sp.]|jgi:DNA-binding CsgD family transcriptional regulator|nr:helix-turn-helix transcriptional regulator [Cypionkella sp.]